jgi:hypothetical protein
MTAAVPPPAGARPPGAGPPSGAGKPPLPVTRRRRWLRRLVIAGVVTPVVIAIVGFWIVPPIVKHVLETQVRDVLGRRVTVGRVRANPFALSLTIDDLQIFETDQRTPFVGFGRLYVNAELASVYHRAPVVREIRLDSPRIHLVRLTATAGAWADPSAYNFSDILARLAARAPHPEPPSEPGPPARFSINNVRITDGKITFDDRPLASTHEISGFDLGVPFVSTLPTFIDTFVEPGLHLSIDGAPFAILGRSKPFKDSLETTLELRAHRLDLTRYLPYVPVPLRFDLVSALLDVAVDVSFVRPSTDAPRLTARGRVALDQVLLREKSAAPLVGLGQLEVVVASADLLAQRFKVDRVAVTGLDVHARRLADGMLNLERLAPAPPGPAPKARAPTARPIGGTTPARQPTAREEPGPRFEIAEIVLEKATLHVRDERVHPAFELRVDDLTASVRGLSNIPGARPATVALGLRATPGGIFKQEGTFSLTPLAASGSFTWEGIEPARFAPYYRPAIAFDVREGRVRLGAKYEFGAAVKEGTAAAAGSGAGSAPSVPVRVTDAFIEVAGLALRRPDARDDFFGVEDLAVRGIDVEPIRHTAAVREIVTRGGRVMAERSAAGVLDLSQLIPPPGGGVGAAGGGRGAGPGATEPRGRPPGPEPPASPVPEPEPPGEPWNVTLGRLELAGWSAHFDDRLVKPRASLTVSPIAVTASGFGTAPGARGTFDVKLGINKRGRLSLSGTAGLAPVTADVKLDLRGLEILPLQPYFADRVNLLVTDGALSVTGRAKVELPPAPARPPGQAPAAAPVPHISFTGDIDLANLASIDGDKHEELLRWKSFHIGRLAVSTVPSALAIADISLTDFYSRLMIFPDAHFNVEDVLTPPAARGSGPPGKAGAETGAKGVLATKGGAANPGRTSTSTAAASSPAASSSAAAPRISIGQVTLQGGHVSFTDRLIRPNYAAELTDLAGRVSGLSADGATQADVDVRGSLDHSGNLSIVGKVNPLAKDLFVDLKVRLEDFELPPTSPYAGKYAGYGISKGKLSLALDYHIADRKLDARNRLVIDQFTFGDKVASPDATGLPVRLAVALLKDRNGVIDIDLPVAGSLDNPDFKVGRAVLKVLGNLIVKAATAPFSMIASLFGGGEELSRLDFAPGAASLDAKGRSKVTSLAKALDQRPGLSFEIEGGADRERDREGLERNLYERKLKTQKLLELVESGAAVSSDPDGVVFDAAERDRLVDKAYRAETFPKPRNALGRPKELPVPEMEKLLLANTIVDDDALRALAERRATTVREALARAAPSGAERLFLIPPRLTIASEGPGNRVEFKLKKN